MCTLGWWQGVVGGLMPHVYQSLWTWLGQANLCPRCGYTTYAVPDCVECVDDEAWDRKLMRSDVGDTYICDGHHSMRRLASLATYLGSLFLGPSQKDNCIHALHRTISAILIPGLGDLAVFSSSRDGAVCDCRGGLECAGCACSSIQVAATSTKMCSLPISRFWGSSHRAQHRGLPPCGW